MLSSSPVQHWLGTSKTSLIYSSDDPDKEFGAELVTMWNLYLFSLVCEILHGSLL